MTKHALVIALEDYADAAVDALPYARRDAEAFSAALQLHGFTATDQHLLLDEQATCNAVRQAIDSLAALITADDTLYLYYAGHAFSREGHIVLACHDTQAAERLASGVPLRDLIEPWSDIGCRQLVLFLDLNAGGSSHTPPPLADDLQAIVQDNPPLVALAACTPGETSQRSNTLRHGIWAYHLIEAFRGEAPLALEQGLLTVGSLGDYLADEVPRTIRLTFRDRREQTPWSAGPTDGEYLADLREIRRRRAEAITHDHSPFTEVALMASDTHDVKRLSAWKKTFQVPDRASDSNETFVARLCTADLQQDLDAIYDSLRQAFGFRRRDLDAPDPTDGAGSIITPYFNYSITVLLNPDDPSQVTWTRQVDAIRQPEQIASAAFATVFDRVFDTLEFSLGQPLDLEDFIDAVEAAEIPGLTLDYDRQLTYCDLQLPDEPATIRLTPRVLAIVHDRPTETGRLIESFNTIRSLVYQHNVPLRLTGPVRDA